MKAWEGEIEHVVESDGAEYHQITQYQGSLNSLEQRLIGVQNSVNVQRRLLPQTTGQLTHARARLSSLRISYRRDRVALAQQLRAQYESPPPSIVNVVVSARGFDSLINQISDMVKLRRSNQRTIVAVATARKQVAAQAKRLTALRARHNRSTAAVVVERDNLAQLKLSTVSKQLRTRRARNADTSQLTSSSACSRTRPRARRDRGTDSAELRRRAGRGPRRLCQHPVRPARRRVRLLPGAGANYSVNQEPIIAARLDALGKALDLHLIGLSGYRTPEHSVEVDGFPNDPHTQGEASDTPGVEGVAESVLEQFCLTRPFAGPAEADHIQELGTD